MTRMQTTPSAAASFHAEVSQGERFTFGENWSAFLKVVDQERIDEAKASLREMLGVTDLGDQTFLDIGCGSGLFSLAAAQMGARKVHSFDFDPRSVACSMELRDRYFPGSGDTWTIEQGNALDADYVRSLGSFDVVYSWGVLHHTGDMWRAMENATSAVADGGRLFIAIYNDQGLRSKAWRLVKRFYNRLPEGLRTLFALLVMVPRESLSLAKAVALGRPGDYVSSWVDYKRSRGMSRWHDLIDWVGGYPFEVATPEAVFDYLRGAGFELERLRTCGGGLGCNQYVARRALVRS